MKRTIYWVSVQIVSVLMNFSDKKTRKIYRKVICNDCVPLEILPHDIQNRYFSEYLLRGSLIDFSFLDAIKDYSIAKPLFSKEVQELFREMTLMRKAMDISHAYTAEGTSTARLRSLCREYGISYSTFSRKRSMYMNNTALSRVLSHNHTTEDTKDRYRSCCYYCRDLIIYLHEQPGKISGAKIFRDIRDAKPFSCRKCPYHPDVKNGPHNKSDFIPAATCKRGSEYMIKPNCEDTVHLIIGRIPEQQDVLAWEGVKSWAGKYHFTPARMKPYIVNSVWFSDHKQLDLFVRTRRLPNGKWEIRRPWITAIMDAASDVLVAYVLSLNPNSDCIAECFARACAFTVDTPYSGIPDYFYIDGGKDFNSKKLSGLPNSDEDKPLYLNKEFGESGILEWFGIKVITALPYRGCSKTIERVWKTIDDEWIRKLKGYCGSTPEERPFVLDEQIKTNDLYTFEQFADYFADTIYPGYNSFSVTKEAPDKLYETLPHTDSFVPTWRTLAVLKSVSDTRVLRQKGLQFDNSFYWCPELGPLIEKEEKTKFRIFAFDTPFNRNISVVKDHTYIGEAHMIEKLNVAEKNRYKVIQHVIEQRKQHKFYSTKIKQLHNIVLQTDILSYVDDTPEVDNIRYAQAIDEERDKNEAMEDTSIPEELKAQAEKYTENFLDPDSSRAKPGAITNFYAEIGRQARKKF